MGNVGLAVKEERCLRVVGEDKKVEGEGDERVKSVAAAILVCLG